MYGFIRPIFFALPPEIAHGLTLAGARLFGRLLWRSGRPDPRLSSKLFGLTFGSPIGIAAGFDKNAALGERLGGFGAGFAEIGTVTPRAQAGNSKPRVFRLVEDEAVINRLGFNNIGAERVARRLSRRRGTLPLAVNIGANRDSGDRAADYASCLARLADHADMIVVNVSSPNTPGLRLLQEAARLDDLLGQLSNAVAKRENGSLPLLLKVAPDLDSEQRKDIVSLALTHRVSGLVVSNTTLERPAGLKSRHRNETGGLSGRPLFDLSTQGLLEFYRLSEGKLPLIGVGGVSSAETAYRKIRAGASLIELYTALIFQGPGLIGRINRGLAQSLERDGFNSVSEAVGKDA